MEVSRVSALIHRRCGVTVVRISLLLRPPSATLPAYGSTTRSASSAHCWGLVSPFERCYGRMARVRWLASSRSSGSTTCCPYQQWLAPFWSHFGNPRSQLEGRNTDYIMYSTFLIVYPGSVLFSRSALLKRKDLCFSCLRLGLIRHRRSKKPHYWVERSVKPNGLLMFWIVFHNKVSDRVKQRARSKTTSVSVLGCREVVFHCDRLGKHCSN